MCVSLSPSPGVENPVRPVLQSNALRLRGLWLEAARSHHSLCWHLVDRKQEDIGDHVIAKNPGEGHDLTSNRKMKPCLNKWRV